MSDKVTITYLNREGGGFAERHTLDAGTTVSQFLAARGINADNCTIRVVRTGQGGFTPTDDEIFQEGDRLSCVPLKIEGAGSARSVRLPATSSDFGELSRAVEAVSPEPRRAAA